MVCRHFRETTAPYKRDRLEYLAQCRMVIQPYGPAQPLQTPSTLQRERKILLINARGAEEQHTKCMTTQTKITAVAAAAVGAAAGAGDAYMNFQVREKRE